MSQLAHSSAHSALGAWALRDEEWQIRGDRNEMFGYQHGNFDIDCETILSTPILHASECSLCLTRPKKTRKFDNQTPSMPLINNNPSINFGVLFLFNSIPSVENSLYNYSKMHFINYHFITSLYRFLDASSHLYKRVCPLVGRSVG